MKRPLSLLICLPLIWWLWKRDQRDRPKFSWALWIPTTWLLVLGSHSVSWWLGIGGSGGDIEGNSFDRTIYLAQIFASIYIVSKRGIRWGSLIQQNKGLMIYYLFLLTTTLWAPYSFVSFKRWFKDLGAIPVLLVILTEEHPLEALKAVFTRCAFVLYPLSVIFIKYFPSIGRGFSMSGEPMASGVTAQKNSLGEIVLVFGLVMVSGLSRPNRPPGRRIFQAHHLPAFFILLMGIYLLLVCNSKTSLICLVIGSAVVLAYKLPMFRDNPAKVVALVLIIPPLFYVGETTFQISDFFLGLVGRDRTLTERTSVWKGVAQDPPNAIIGTGYMMYWDIHRTIMIGDEVGVLGTAHNGYLETYVDGGSIGVGFLIIMLLWAGKNAVREFLTGSEYGRMRLAFFVVMILYNVSESIYARRSPLWFTFLLMVVQVPDHILEKLRNPVESNEEHALSTLPGMEIPEDIEASGAFESQPAT